MVGFAKSFGRARDKRRTIRRAHNVYAWVKTHGSFAKRRCRIIDISSAGVRLSVDKAAELSDVFNLTLDGGSAQGHRVRVRWRRGNDVGGEFI